MTTIFHSRNARSLRVLWVLEEMGVKADVKTLPFPPKGLEKFVPAVARGEWKPTRAKGDALQELR